ncbi:MAG: hypothetical protein QOF01_3396, partial [Thermomicrobiales bacterium]|nr:hypothetical protein [Thermomicrobiales bacterium]
MKRVGVREFRDNATKYLAGEEALTIERHGEPIGFYFPNPGARRDPQADAERRLKQAESMARLEKTIQGILERTGMSEEEFSRYFDLNEPLPDDPVESS